MNHGGKSGRARESRTRRRCARAPTARSLVFGVLLLLGSPPAWTASQSPPSPDVANVIFIGANHNLTFLHPGFSPAHLRALLSKIAPAALCLEILPGREREGHIPTYPQEQYAALTWARREGVPVYGVDWTPPETRALPPVVRMDDEALMDRGDRFERFHASYAATVRWTADRAFAEVSDDLESWQHRHLATPEYAWPDEGSAALRDDRIAENIRAAVRRHPGRRIAVVFGTGHYLPLKRRLEADGGIGLLPALEFLPLEPDRIEAGWHPDDAVLLLGTNLDDWRSLAAPHSRNHQRTKDLLDRLRSERPGSVVTRYFEARWRMLFGDLEAGREALERIVDEGGATVRPYQVDARWSWPLLSAFEHKARFYVAIAHDLEGNHDAAARQYRALLDLPEDQLIARAFIRGRRLDLRPYLESLIREPYRGGLFEAYRAYLALGR